jgi:transposase
MADEALNNMSARFDAMYAKIGRPSIPPEKLLRAQLVQMLYSIRTERLLMEEIDYSMLFRWFVRMNLDEIGSSSNLPALLSTCIHGEMLITASRVDAA